MGSRILLISSMQSRNPLSMVRAGDCVDVLSNKNPPAPGDIAFDSIEIEALEPEEIKEMLESFKPKSAHRSPAPAGVWSIEPVEEELVWNDNGSWRRLKEQVPHAFHFNLTPEDIENLSKTNISKQQKLEILKAQCIPCFGRHPNNMEAHPGLR